MPRQERKTTEGGKEDGFIRPLFLIPLDYRTPYRASEKGVEPGIYIAVGPLTAQQVEDPPDKLLHSVGETIAGTMFEKPLPDNGGSWRDVTVGIRCEPVGEWPDGNGIVLRIIFQTQKQASEFAAVVFSEP